MKFVDEISSKEDDLELSDLRKAIEDFPVELAVLFGSQARGDSAT
ncbi:MAG: hypothetical protein ABEJ72_03850 [Candidatus Aenigmatarchaeota archaeon]